MPSYRNLARRGIFSAMEVALVLAVLGVVATIVGPRISRAGSISPKAGDQLLVGQLRTLRTAIAAYAADHYGFYPAGDVTKITGQLTQFTDSLGNVSPTRSSRYEFGPYLRGIPALPVSAKKGAATLGFVPQEHDKAWIYDSRSGRIWPNTWPGESDETGRDYVTY